MESYIGSIVAFGFNYAPYGWQQCTGGLLQVRAYTALFALLGANYGGDGQNTFGVPNLQSRAAVCAGQGPGLTDYTMGETVGAEHITLNTTNLPAHNHIVSCALGVNGTPGTETSPVNNFPTSDGTAANFISSTNGFMGSSIQAVLANAGAMNAPVNVPCIRPSLAMNYCIALEGIFPTRP